jgi:alkylated DNA repair dioxygenase AlkB
MWLQARWSVPASDRRLFDTVALPEGFRHADDFLHVHEEAALLDIFRSVDFHEMRMRGVAARRRVVQYGWKYSFESFRMTQGPDLPDYLLPVRDRAAAFAGVENAVLSEALLTEYSPGAAIGWHRDAPGFGIVVGISLASACRFRLRRGQTGAWETMELLLQPRSVYLLEGAARSEWQHSIPAVRELRYSITFRSMKTRTSQL